MAESGDAGGMSGEASGGPAVSEAIIPVEAEGGNDFLSGILKDIAREESKAKDKASTKVQKDVTSVQANDVGDDANDSGDDEEDSHSEDSLGDRHAPPPKKTYKAKANGKEYQFDEDKIEAELSRGLAARQGWEKDKQEIARLKQESEQALAEAKRFRQDIEANPEKYLKDHQDVAERLLRERAEEFLHLQKLPPEAQEEYKARKALEAKLAGYEAEKKKAEEGQHKRLVEEQTKQLEAFLTKGLEEHGLPKNTLTLRIMSGIVQAAARKGIPLDSAKATELARKQLKEVVASSYTKDSVASFIADNPELAEAVRNHYVKASTQEPAEVEDIKPRAPNGQFKPPTKRKTAPREDPFAEIERLKKDAEKERSKIGW